MGHDLGVPVCLVSAHCFQELQIPKILPVKTMLSGSEWKGNQVNYTNPMINIKNFSF